MNRFAGWGCPSLWEITLPCFQGWSTAPRHPRSAPHHPCPAATGPSGRRGRRQRNPLLGLCCPSHRRQRSSRFCTRKHPEEGGRQGEAAPGRGSKGRCMEGRPEAKVTGEQGPSARAEPPGPRHRARRRALRCSWSAAARSGGGDHRPPFSPLLALCEGPFPPSPPATADGTMEVANLPCGPQSLSASMGWRRLRSSGLCVQTAAALHPRLLEPGGRAKGRVRPCQNPVPPSSSNKFKKVPHLGKGRPPVTRPRPHQPLLDPPGGACAFAPPAFPVRSQRVPNSGFFKLNSTK